MWGNCKYEIVNISVLKNNGKIFYIKIYFDKQNNAYI